MTEEPQTDAAIVAVSVVDGVATLTLNDPKTRNSLSMPMVAALAEAMDGIEADPAIGAVVVTGAGSSFCAGADLGNLAEADRSTFTAIYEGFLRIARSPLPTVAAVNGAAVGAGMNMALACDVRIAARRARFDTRFLEIGLHPGGGHTWMLQRLVGSQTASAAVLFGEVIHAEEAERVGLVHRCVDDADLADAVQQFAAKAATFPRELSITVKRTMQEIGGVTDHLAAVERELEPQLWSTRQPWFAERLAVLRSRVHSGPRK